MTKMRRVEESCNQLRCTRRRLLGYLGLSAAGLLPSGQALADGYPNRAVKLLVGFPPGGGLDLVVRVLAPSLEKRLGQPVVVENKPGAAGVLAAATAVRAAPDGYTLVLTVPASTSAAHLLLGKQLQYDPAIDLDPIGMIGVTPLVLLASANNPRIRSLADLETAAQGAGSAEFDIASPGVGSPPHFAMELYKAQSGLPLRHIPFSGSSTALTALLGGQVPAMITTVTAALGQIRAGKITALAITGKEPVKQLPGVPLLAPKGTPIEISGWAALHAPRGTPSSVIERVNHALNETLALDAIQQRLQDLIILTPSSPENVSLHIARETQRLTEVASLFNLSLQ